MLNILQILAFTCMHSVFKYQHLVEWWNECKGAEACVFISNITNRISIVLAWHDFLMYYMSSGCVCPGILYIRPFDLSVTSVYLNWSMPQCATVARLAPCCCSPNVNRYVSMRLERSLTKGGIWPDTAQYANYRQPDEVPFHQHLIWENRRT